MSPEQFFTKQQLTRYKYAVALATKLKQYQQDNFMILDEGGIIDKTWEVIIEDNLDNTMWHVVAFRHENCTHCIIEIEWGGEIPYMPTKKRIKESFAYFRVVDPKHIKKF